MLALHRDGATCPIWMDPTMEPDTRLKPSVNPKSIPDEVLLQDNRKTLEDRDLSFDERFQEICLTVRVSPIPLPLCKHKTNMVKTGAQERCSRHYRRDQTLGYHLCPQIQCKGMCSEC